MKLKKLLVLVFCLFPLFLFASCGSFVGSNEFYRKQYITAYKSVSDAIGEVQKNPVSVRKNVKTYDASAFSVKNYQENKYRDCYKLTNNNIINGVRAFAYFFYLLYKNNLPITQVPVTIDCDYKLLLETIQDNTVTIFSTVDLKAGKIMCDVIGISAEKNALRDTDEFYLHLDIDFDFGSRKIGGFSIEMVGIVGEELSLNNGFSCFYEDGKMYLADSWSFGDRANDYISELKSQYYLPYLELSKKAVRAKRDYSPEYIKAMNFVR